MRSSRSSFSTELKVVAAVVVTLLAVELGMRMFESSLSIDVRHIRSAPEIAARLQTDAQSDILFLGNSLTRYGIDPATVKEELATAGVASPNVQLFHPDGTSITEWAYGFRRFFAETGKLPDAMVIVTGRTHLNDARQFQENVGAYYCSVRDIPRFFRNEVRSLEEAARFLLARVSSAYASRHRVQPRLFTAVIPHYQEMLALLTKSRNDALKKKMTAAGAKAEPPEATYRNLTALLSLLSENDVPTAVVAIPMPDPYEFSPQLEKTLEAHHVPLIDARALEGISEGNFPDDYHLDRDGARIVSRHTARQLSPLWEKLRP